MRGVHANSTGLRRLFFSPTEEAVTEEKIIAPGHGSREFDIVEINGVAIVNFSFVQLSLRDITLSGETGTPDLGIRFSEDGGATWIDGVADYARAGFSATAVLNDTGSYGILANFTSFANCSAWIRNLNALTPTSVVTGDMDAAETNPMRRCVVTLNSAVAHTALQIFIGGGGGTPVFTGGTLDLAGYK